MCISANERERDLVYKIIGDRKLSLTYLPPINKLYEYAPVYFIIPGGGWHFETRASMLDFSASSVEELRKNGFAAVSIDYRVTDEPGIGIGEIISDCFDAARYISHNREALAVAPNRFAVSGHSAGGHLALMLAYAPHDMFRCDSVLKDDFTVRAAAALSAPTVLYEDGLYQTLNIDTESLFIKDKSISMRKKASPCTYINPDSPPTIMCAGTSDRLVFSNSSELLYKKLREADVKCELVLSVCGGHCFEQIHEGIVPKPSHDDIQKLITDFILENI